jgi:hypothetical protein
MEDIKQLDDFSKLVKDDYFKLYHLRLVLIYNKYLDKIDLKEFLDEIVKKQKGKKIIEFYICLGKNITSCVLKFNNNLIYKQGHQNMFDFNNCHPIIRTLYSNKHNYDDCLDYFIKTINDEDPYTNIPELNKGRTLVERVKNCKTVNEVVKMTDDPSNVKKLLDIYSLSTEQKLTFEDLSKHPWQLDLIKLVNTPISKEDRRLIYWYFDPEGNTGKTELATYLEDNYPNDVLVITEGTSPYHLSTVVKNEKNKGWNGKICIFDIPRTMEIRKTMYSSLESIRNGKMTVIKYNGEKIRFDCQYLIVFANFKPETTGTLSLDRWIIIQIHPLTYKASIIYDGPKEYQIELMKKYPTPTNTKQTDTKKGRKVGRLVGRSPVSFTEPNQDFNLTDFNLSLNNIINSIKKINNKQPSYSNLPLDDNDDYPTGDFSFDDDEDDDDDDDDDEDEEYDDF